jgi:hypothetical protein
MSYIQHVDIKCGPVTKLVLIERYCGILAMENFVYIVVSYHGTLLYGKMNIYFKTLQIGQMLCGNWAEASYGSRLS